jgi:hypothetical protein
VFDCGAPDLAEGLVGGEDDGVEVTSKCVLGVGRFVEFCERMIGNEIAPSAASSSPAKTTPRGSHEHPALSRHSRRVSESPRSPGKRSPADGGRHGRDAPKAAWIMVAARLPRAGRLGSAASSYAITSR